MEGKLNRKYKTKMEPTKENGGYYIISKRSYNWLALE
jgi:hypothetical protein